MKPLSQWTTRSQWALVVVIGLMVGLLFVGMATSSDEPSLAETARYERVRRECTAAADNLGLRGRQRTDGINDCMLNRY